MKVLVFILGLSILILFHEFGHFLAAKIFNVYVYEFSLFMGPKLFQIKRGETKYTIRLLPIGGYCSMAGEEDAQADRNENEASKEDYPPVPLERSMKGIKNWKKIIIMAAGAVNNILLSFIFLLIFGLSQYGVKPNFDNCVFENGPKTGETIKNFEVRFYEGEYVLSENEEDVAHVFQGRISIEPQFYSQLESCYDEAFVFMHERCVDKYGDENGVLTTVPTSCNLDFYITTDAGEYVHKTTYSINFNEDKTEIINNIEFSSLGLKHGKRLGLLKATGYAFRKQFELGTTIIKSLKLLFTKEGINNLSSFVGIYRVSTTFMAEGLWYYIFFLAFISVNLGIMNLLPFPALDGGRIVLTIIESITKKPTPKKLEAILNSIGFIILFGLMILITIKELIFQVII